MRTHHYCKRWLFAADRRPTTEWDFRNMSALTGSLRMNASYGDRFAHKHPQRGRCVLIHKVASQGKNAHTHHYCKRWLFAADRRPTTEWDFRNMSALTGSLRMNASYGNILNTTNH